MHRPQEQVRDFHRACGLRVEEHEPRIHWFESQGLRFKLIKEEVAEFKEALDFRQQEGSIREACDILYVLYGWAVANGIDLEPYFEEVHRANMAKASGPKREDGKQLKPEGWEPPDLLAVSRRLYNRTRILEND